MVNNEIAFIVRHICNLALRRKSFDKRINLRVLKMNKLTQRNLTPKREDKISLKLITGI
ncbi:MAG: hypothetical protein ACTS6G_05750 [Candidatus Hodgkinia cicadicola]